MLRLRAILPAIASGLCTGFLVLTFSYAFLGGNKVQVEIQGQTQGIHFQPAGVDTSALFTRASADSEGESEDAAFREHDKDFIVDSYISFAIVHSRQSIIRSQTCSRTFPTVRQLPVILQKLLI